MTRTPWDAQEAVNIINNLKSQLQKSIEREEQIERELQAEKAKADALEEKLRLVNISAERNFKAKTAARVKVNMLVGALNAFANFLGTASHEEQPDDFTIYSTVRMINGKEVESNLTMGMFRKAREALAKAKEATRNTKTD